MKTLQRITLPWIVWLTQPSPAVREPFDRLRSQLLAAVTLIFILLIIPFSLARHLPDTEGNTRQERLMVNIAVIAILMVSFIFNRRGYYSIAAGIIIGAAMIVPFAFTAGQDYQDITPLRYLIVAIIGSSIFFSIRTTLFIILIDLVGLLMVGLFAPNIYLDDIVYDPLRLNLIIGVVVLISLYYQHRLHLAQRNDLSHSEERFRMVSDLVSDYAFSLSVDENQRINVEWITEAFERITGYTREELDTEWDIMVHPDDHTLVRQHLDTLLNGQAHVTEVRLITKSGKTVWLRNHGKPILTDGRVKGIYGAGQNITAQKEAETQKMAILNAIPDLMLRISGEGTYLEYYTGNPDDLVAPPEVFLGKRVTDILPMPEALQTMKHVALTLETSEMQVFEYQLTLNGQVQHYEARMVVNGENEILSIIRNISPRRKTEQALLQSQARFRAVVESQTELVCRYTPDLVLTFVNEAYARALGKTPNELIGTSILSFIPPDQHENVKQHVSSLIQKPRTVVYEGQAVSSTGSLRWLKWTDQAILDSSQHVTEIQGVGSDITELKQAQDELKQRIEEMKFLGRIDRELGYNLEINQIVNLAMDMAIRRSGAKSCDVGWLEENTRLLKRMATIGEHPLLPESIEFAPYFEQFFTEKRQRFNVQQDENGVSLFLKLEYRGAVRGLMTLGNLSLQPDANLDLEFLLQLADRMAAAIQNAGEYQSIEKRAKQMETLYQLSYELAATLDYDQVLSTAVRVLLDLLDASSTFVYEYDTQTKAGSIHSQYIAPIVFDNIQHSKLLQQCLAQTQSSPQSHLIIYRHLPDIDEETATLLDTLGVQSMLVLPLGEDRVRREILVLCESRYARYFLEDEITLALNLVGQVMVALQRARVVADLQEAESVKSEMIRVASHDLRNPVTQIHGYAELLAGDLDGMMTDLRKEYLDNIQRGVAKMKQLLEDILNLERVESQRPSAWQSVSLRPILEEVVTTLISQTDLRRQTCKVDIPSHIPPIVGSDIQLEQACLNLVQNAIKYTPEGGNIMISAHIQDERFYFEVKDNGYGIPAERQDRLFQRFYRAITPGTEHIGGTGLGLSLVKTVVERHGGSVFFESQLGLGSTFGFWLPLKKTTQNLIDPNTPPA